MDSEARELRRLDRRKDEVWRVYRSNAHVTRQFRASKQGVVPIDVLERCNQP